MGRAKGRREQNGRRTAWGFPPSFASLLRLVRTQMDGGRWCVAHVDRPTRTASNSDQHLSHRPPQEQSKFHTITAARGALKPNQRDSYHQTTYCYGPARPLCSRPRDGRPRRSQSDWHRSANQRRRRRRRATRSYRRGRGGRDGPSSGGRWEGGVEDGQGGCSGGIRAVEQDRQVARRSVIYLPSIISIMRTRGEGRRRTEGDGFYDLTGFRSGSSAWRSEDTFTAGEEVTKERRVACAGEGGSVGGDVRTDLEMERGMSFELRYL